PFPLYRLFFCPANRVWGQPLVWRFRFVDWWTVLFVLLCGAALAMLIWRRRPESAPEEDTDEE
ncbi:hypothetical protein, partial [Ruthenibacterium lactatiformans]|uniref:hypothetical protein n=1 Tax=Ruthenibacterium lactatiformans TaxID=1550024 RepID=UPI001967DE8B